MGLTRLPSGYGLSPYSGEPAIRFGATLQSKIDRYRQSLPELQSRLDEKARRESQDNFRKIQQEIQAPSHETVTKQPGQNVFWSIRNPLGILRNNDPRAGKEKPQGLFNNDMQHLDHFVIKSGSGDALNLEQSREFRDPQTGEQGFEMAYSLQDNPNVLLTRRQTIDDHGNVRIRFSLSNNGSQDESFDVEMGSQGRDIFQARAVEEAVKDSSKPGAQGDKPKLNTVIEHKAVQQDGSIDLIASHHLPEAAKKAISDDPASWYNPGKSNSIHTRFTPSGQFDSFTLANDTTVNLKMSVKPGEHKTADVTVNLSSDRFGKPAYFPSLYKRTWNAFATSLNVKTSDRSMRHLPQMWRTSFSDLQALTIPVQCGKATFFPPAAGIPNFLALFGRDSLITSLETLQFNPLLARDTLSSLAYYQGKADVAETEEESGKILHELRLGETTRLGISPHRPYYGTIDATPLFCMVFGEYLRRTADTTLERVLWPNFEAALQWIDTHVSSDPADPQYGFLTQRDKKVNSGEEAGATGLKNIGWKDSEGATRHLVEDRHGNLLDKGADGKIHSKDGEILVDEKGQLTDDGKAAGLKLTYATYPLALAEVQGYVYGAWRSAQGLYARRSITETDPAKREEFRLKADHYKKEAEALKTRFNRKFWMPNENFIAMAIQGDGRQLTSVTSNGAQALMSGIVDRDKAEKMARRLMQPDMASGWGVRTLSAYSFAYDPFAYHNGTIWPHDNALIMMGLARYNLKDAKTGLDLGSQILRAGGKFKNSRLPELYTGMPKEKGDRTIPVYPNTCIPQAWAAGTAPSVISSLLGLQVDELEKQICLRNPVLPEGVNAMRLTLGVTPSRRVENLVEENKLKTIEQMNTNFREGDARPGEPISLLIERQKDNTLKIRKVGGAPDIKLKVHNSSAPNDPNAAKVAFS